MKNRKILPQEGVCTFLLCHGQGSSPRYRCMWDHVLACQVMSSCFCVFPAQLKVGVECLAWRTEKFFPRNIFLCCGCSCAYVCICSRAQKGVCDRDGQGQVRRLPFVSHGCGQSSSPRYRCMLDHVLHVACQVMSSCFFVFPVWWSIVSLRKDQTNSSPGRCVHLFAVAVVVHMFVLFRMQQVTERSVWQRWSGSSPQTPLVSQAVEAPGGVSGNWSNFARH